MNVQSSIVTINTKNPFTEYQELPNTVLCLIHTDRYGEKNVQKPGLKFYFNS